MRVWLGGSWTNKIKKHGRINMKEIEDLIPHRHPFLFVDEIISANQDEIVGIKTFDESIEFINGHFPWMVHRKKASKI